MNHRGKVEERVHFQESEPLMTHRRASGWCLDDISLRKLRENMMWYPLSFIICNTKPVGYQVNSTNRVVFHVWACLDGVLLTFVIL